MGKAVIFWPHELAAVASYASTGTCTMDLAMESAVVQEAPLSIRVALTKVRETDLPPLVLSVEDALLLANTYQSKVQDHLARQEGDLMAERRVAHASDIQSAVAANLNSTLALRLPQALVASAPAWDNERGLVGWDDGLVVAARLEEGGVLAEQASIASTEARVTLGAEALDIIAQAVCGWDAIEALLPIMSATLSPTPNGAVVLALSRCLGTGNNQHSLPALAVSGTSVIRMDGEILRMIADMVTEGAIAGDVTFEAFQDGSVQVSAPECGLSIGIAGSLVTVAGDTMPSYDGVRVPA